MKYIEHRPRHQDIKIWVAILFLIVLIPLISGYFLRSESPLAWIPLGLIITFLLFNLLVRKSLAFKNYFTSPYNLLTAKVRFEQRFDIPQELMFNKIIEVVNDSPFTFVAADKERFELLATSGISFQSWGENLYISVEKSGDETAMKCCSATLFQLYAWGKNEKNIHKLLDEIEYSLTI